MTKKERIEHLEAEVAELHEKLAELIAKLDNSIVIPKATPGTTFPNLTTLHCLNCGQSYQWGTFHNCPNNWWDPNNWKITCTSGEVK